MRHDNIEVNTTLVDHNATQSDEHALEIIVHANGFGDVKGLDIDYDTGAVGSGDDEAVILVNIDESNSTGGDVIALEVLATGGTAETNAILVGAEISPIRQISGTFADMTSALVNATDRLAEFTSAGSDIDFFVADNDTVTIGSTARFEEIEFILSTVASKNCLITFEYSTGVGTWAAFNPVDGTNGMLNTGVIAWLDSDIPSWATGLASEYLIRMTRTVNGSITNPVEDLVQIVSGTEYCWDKDGNVKASNLNLDGLSSYEDDAAAGVGGLVAGDVYQTSGTGAGALLSVAGVLMIKQ